jgi:hypothetical protein
MEKCEKCIETFENIRQFFTLYAQMIETPSASHRGILEEVKLTKVSKLPRQDSGPALRYGLRI